MRRLLFLPLLLALVACDTDVSIANPPPRYDVSVEIEPEQEVAAYEEGLDFQVAQYIPAYSYVSFDDIRLYVGRRATSAELEDIMSVLMGLGLQKAVPATNEVLYRWPDSRRKTAALNILSS
jgi:hypothetical protein